MSTRESTKTVSYRRNRDYTTAYVWTYELNRDGYQCYRKAKDDPKNGYMKRMKKLWDEMHPEFIRFNEKQLRQQATFVEKKGLIVHPNTSTIAEDTTVVNVVPNNTDGEENVVGLENVNMEDIVVENIDLILVEEIKNKFIHYVNIYENLTLAQRNYNTQVIYHIKEQEWKAINYVIEEFTVDHAERMDLWLLNVIQYAAIITILDRYDLLKERKHHARESKIPTWQKIIEEKINNLRRKISYILVVKKCQMNCMQFTKHQLTIKAKLKRWYGNTKEQTLAAQLSKLNHELKVSTESLRHRKKLAERNKINNDFKLNQKQVFRHWKGNQINVTDGPSKDEVTSFWSGIWGEPKTYNRDATWLSTLDNEYCKDVAAKKYEITADTMNRVLTKMKNNGAPGNDLIRCYWVKKLSATHSALVLEFKKTFEQGEILPLWMVTGRTILTPKNEQTKQAKNYRPIACQNIMYKIYTSILNSFLVDHCVTNNIVTIEQAGGKPGSWGCTDQLLVNKMILDEVQKHRRNLFMMWFDYKKAFDSVPHDWILKSLRLARVPQEIIGTIENLMKVWSTRLYLKDIESDIINYQSGVLQGDCLSLIVFILCLNPLSFLLKKLPGYKPGPPGERDSEISHLFFVDDLKTYASDIMGAKAQLDLITSFTDDIGMELGNDKCAYINIARGKITTLGEKFGINGIELNELEAGEKYKYLGQDEDIGYDNVLNKDRVTKEYFKRVRKIWSSELFSNYKTIAHNIFAIPVITPTIGILEWTKDELEQIDIKTRKILTSSGSFHINSDIDRLYAPRNKGGRGLNSLVDLYISRIVSISHHLKEIAVVNPYIDLVMKHESERLLRVAEQLKTSFDISTSEDKSPKEISKEIKEEIKEKHVTTWKKKPQHGYLFRTRQSVAQVNEDLSNAWMKKSSFSSHVEGYLCAIQEEEIATASLRAKRSKNEDVNPNCRLCKCNRETIQHVVAACPKLSASMYLPLRHNKVCNVVYQNIIQKDTHKGRMPIQTYYANDDIDVWWDVKIKTLTNCEHNKPDIVLWKKSDRKCYIIDVRVGLDVNIEKNIKTKHDNYLPLAAELKRLYSDYTFEVIPIVLGATGLVTSHVRDSLKKIGIENVNEVIAKCQKSALLGTLKIVKSFMKM